MWLAREQQSNGKVFFSIHPPSIPRGGAGGLLEKKLKLLVHANYNHAHAIAAAVQWIFPTFVAVSTELSSDARGRSTAL
jgi:hypothetical protein